MANWGERPGTAAIQEKILRFINEYITAHGYSPSIREICDGTGLASANSGIYQLGKMQEKGLIRREKKTQRTVTLTAHGERMISD